MEENGRLKSISFNFETKQLTTVVFVRTTGILEVKDLKGLDGETIESIKI